MVMSEERLKVLKMLQDGRISADEATQLLEALEGSRAGGSRAAEAPIPPARRGRWLLVRVTDTDTGKLRVNVRLPLNVVEAGMKMGMRFSPEIQDIDPSQLMAVINSGEVGHIVDVYDEKDGEHVEVSIE